MTWFDYFIYSNGLLLWENKRSNSCNDVAGCIDKISGYRLVTLTINGVKKRYYQHRIIWEMHNGPIPDGFEIDHIDHDRTNNKIDNLRLASKRDNKRNYTRLKNNTSGITGVCWHKGFKKWQATIYDNDGRRVYLGRFDNIEDACRARKVAEMTYCYHDNHGKQK